MTNHEQNKMMEEYIHLVHQVARRISAKATQDYDAIQSGMIGLWQACQKWDGKRPFAPFARLCIRSRIIDYLRSNRSDDIFAEEKEGHEDPHITSITTSGDILPLICSIFPRRSRERRVLMSLLAGKKKRSIAKRLGCSVRTVDRISKRAWFRIQAEKERQGL